MDRTQKAILRSELRRDEGERLEAYKDSVGLWTIGVGHLLGSSPRMTKITPPESTALLDADIDNAEALVLLAIPQAKDLDDVRYRAVVNMAFNLGARLLQFHKFLVALGAGQWDAASYEMLDSKWAHQVGARATRLAEQIKTGRQA